jgi:hypothetical protein
MRQFAIVCNPAALKLRWFGKAVEGSTNFSIHNGSNALWHVPYGSLAFEAVRQDYSRVLRGENSFSGPRGPR